MKAATMIFEITTKLNKTARLTEIQWKHISMSHKEFNRNQIQKIRKEGKVIAYEKDIHSL